MSPGRRPNHERAPSQTRPPTTTRIRPASTKPRPTGDLCDTDAPYTARLSADRANKKHSNEMMSSGSSPRSILSPHAPQLVADLTYRDRKSTRLNSSH